MTDEDKRNRRQERRRKVRIASIIVSEVLPPIPCVILDISLSGARLHVHDHAEIPDRFTLVQSADKQLHSCTVVWRNENEMGVRFET